MKRLVGALFAFRDAKVLEVNDGSSQVSKPPFVTHGH